VAVLSVKPSRQALGPTEYDATAPPDDAGMFGGKSPCRHITRQGSWNMPDSTGGASAAFTRER